MIITTKAATIIVYGLRRENRGTEDLLTNGLIHGCGGATAVKYCG
jgi:hypothetical protein